MRKSLSDIKTLIIKDILDYIRDPFTVTFMFLPMLLPALLLICTSGDMAALGLDSGTISDALRHASEILPMFIVIFTFSGGASFISDTLAGEWERGTMERILSTQVNGFSIVVSKIITSVLISMVSMVLALLSALISCTLLNMEMPSVSISMPLKTVSLICLLIALTCAALMVTLSITCRSMRESSFRLGLLALLPVILGMINNSNIAPNIPWLRFIIPIGNLMLLLQHTIEANIDSIQFASVICCSVLYLVLLISASCRLFNRARSSL